MSKEYRNFRSCFKILDVIMIYGNNRYLPNFEYKLIKFLILIIGLKFKIKMKKNYATIAIFV